MWEESSETPKKLKTGLTTGACATACCVAACHRLLGNAQPDVVSLTLPKGSVVEMPITQYEKVGDAIRVSTIKDAGDDPDVTHGAIVFVDVTLCEQKGVSFNAAKGVGTVTREGLALAVGEPAINPVPREMMTQHLTRLAEFYSYTGGFSVAVGVVNGETIALKTMNPRLGILGGLSILGTTGIVRPFSCAAWIASIYQGIDVANANNITRIAATTGNSSEKAIQAFYALHDMALIEMGDFAGAVLKHLKQLEKIKPTVIRSLSICGGIGKISKLADGHMDLNSRVSDINFTFFAQMVRQLGGDETLQTKILHANTSIEVLNLCNAAKVDIAHAICQQALEVAQRIVPERIEIEVSVINRQGVFVGSTNPLIYCNASTK